MEKPKFNLDQLAKKKEPFTIEEKEFIKSKVPATNFEARYAIYKPKSKKGCQIAFVYNSHRMGRKSAVERFWDVQHVRWLNDIEYDEKIANYGCNWRCFQVHYYETIEKLIIDDAKYGIKTPQSFVNHCIRLGYTDGTTKKTQVTERKSFFIESPESLKIELETQLQLFN